MPIRFEYAIDVEQTPEQAFRLFDNLGRTPEWLGPCTALEELAPGENNVGDKLKYTYKEGGRTGTMEGEITARIPNERLTCSYWDKMFEVVVDSQVSKTEKGARLTNAIEMTPKTFLAKLVSPLVRKQLPKQRRPHSDGLQSVTYNPYDAHLLPNPR